MRQNILKRLKSNFNKFRKTQNIFYPSLKDMVHLKMFHKKKINFKYLIDFIKMLNLIIRWIKFNVYKNY